MAALQSFSFESVFGSNMNVTRFRSLSTNHSFVHGMRPTTDGGM
jgi:hypothetical protein